MRFHPTSKRITVTVSKTRAGLLAAAAIAGLGLASPSVLAAGFYIKEQSVTGLGRAFAGETAIAGDASTIYYNPAGLTRLSRAEVNVGAHVLFPNEEFENRGSAFGPLLNIPTGGGNGGNPYDPTLVPNIYGAMPLMGGRLWIGAGVTAPFGLANKYHSAWFGRYDSIKSELTTIDAAPTIAYKFNDSFSLGAGLDIQYADAELTNAVPTPGPFGSIRIGPAGDLISRLEGDDVSVGFNVGALFAPSSMARIGLHYRSAVSHTLEGDVRVETRSAALVQSFAGEADLDLPDIAALGATYQVSSSVTAYGEVSWYGWNRFKEIRVIRRASGTAASDVDQNYEDTFSVSVGAEYTPDDRWTVRAGYQFDETPTVDEFRSTRTPDGDRNWLAAGLSCALNEGVLLDAAYAHIFIDDANVDVLRAPGSPGAGAGSITRGQSDGSVNIISLGLRRRF